MINDEKLTIGVVSLSEQKNDDIPKSEEAFTATPHCGVDSVSPGWVGDKRGIPGQDRDDENVIAHEHNMISAAQKSKLTIYELTSIALMTAILAVLAQIAIPVGPVPFTLQSIGVIAAALLLPRKNAVLAILVYIMLGLAGLPVIRQQASSNTLTWLFECNSTSCCHENELPLAKVNVLAFPPSVQRTLLVAMSTR